MTPHTRPPTVPAVPMPHLHLVEVRTTRRDRVVSVLLALVNVPAFAMMFFLAFLWGPEQLFGEYSHTAGRQAVLVLILALVAASGWAFFFASYTRAGMANVLGFVILGAAVALDVLMLVQKMQLLTSARQDAGLPDTEGLPWSVIAAPVAWAILPVLCAVALRRPSVRWIALAPIAVVGAAGFALLASRLAAGGIASIWVLAFAAPLVTSLLTLDAVFPDRTRADHGPSPR